MNDPARLEWIQRLTGWAPDNRILFLQALTHGSASPDHYERLEFLGDRVLGLVIGAWLYQLYPDEPEGKLSARLNQLVSREICAEIAREIGLQEYMILGKQARDDGARDSANVLCDMLESLLGALYIDAGIEKAGGFIRCIWNSRATGSNHAPKHPKSELQEWAAAHKRKTPEYVLAERSGPAHAPHFTVVVSIRNVGEAQATGSSKQEAETEAARKLLEQLNAL
ncbi:MAG: ribonuclease III [Sphingobium sp.]|nr:ribonuclease III [Sphingobium sp.]MBP6112519.1 ribonuclease III [Sphingobium sp.]MBP8669948.1 ribonuclease III [Sphingobium sp.]MBP9158340.1 ribonuclease III [Sphingobium sp.]MCC6480972.1 ribonuclease III [Sphingomonadaceae bacterium]